LLPASRDGVHRVCIHRLSCSDRVRLCQPRDATGTCEQTDVCILGPTSLTQLPTHDRRTIAIHAELVCSILDGRQAALFSGAVV
jgi:hypothetical protein